MKTWPHGDAGRVKGEGRETVDEILRAYGPLSTRQIGHLLHSDTAWRYARQGVPAHERSTNVIHPLLISEYYRLLDEDEGAILVEEWASTSR